MLTFAQATKRLCRVSTGANGQNEDAISKLPIANPCEKPCFWHLRILGESLRKSICESLQILARIRILAKACETMNCKSLRNTAKPYLRICAKLAKACEITFANPCETEVFLRMHICETLRKYMHFALANPCENTICETLRKVYLLTAPPRLRARHRTRLLSLVLLNVFTLFVVTILKPIVSVSADFLSFVCPNPDMPTNQRRNTVTQLFQEHKIVCNLPDLSCSHKFFRLKSLSRRVRNDRLSA